MFIFKICDESEWVKATKSGIYLGSSDDLRDGFIHFSTEQQLAGTAAKHFSARDDLLLIAFSADAFADSLRWETSRGGALFPHVYGPVDIKFAIWVKPLPLGKEGHILPDLDKA